MKNILLTTALLTGMVLVPAAAHAEVELKIGGHAKLYTTWNDQDEAPGIEARSFDIVRQTEIHLEGETTLDNGLTVGYHTELEADGGDGFEVEQGWAYFSGGWGKVHFGASESPTYILQVAAPSADSNVDGMRQTVNAVNYTAAGIGAPGTFDYDHVTPGAGYADKIAYFTPVFSGFQAGISYAPDLAAGGFADSFGVRTDDDAGGYGDAFEGALRYETKFNDVAVKLGAGYSHAGLEEDAAGADDRQVYNLGANIGFGAFKVGAAYLHDDNGEETDGDTTIWVLGADYTTGPFVIGASYYDREDETNNATAAAFGAETDTDRLSLGVTYKYGPGMTLRGSFHHLEHDADTGGTDVDADYVMFGTQINF